MQDRLIYRPFGLFRLLLAFMVVAQHFIANVAPESLAPLARVYPIGSTAVLAFFVLSGFIITEAAERVYSGRPVDFIINRGLRIAPHFAIAAGLTIATCWMLANTGTLVVERNGIQVPPDAFALRNIALNFVSFLPGADHVLRYNFLVIGWTLRIEILFYGFAMVTLALAACRRISFPILAAASAGVLIPLFAVALAGRIPSGFLYVPYFAFGAAAYAAISRRNLLARAVALLALAGIAVEFWAHADASAVQFILLLMLIAAMLRLATQKAGRCRDIDRRAGDLTYPLYLCHDVVGVVFQSWTSCDTYFGLVLAVLASLGLAYLLHRLVDPAVDQLRSRIRDGRAYLKHRNTALAQ